MSFMKEAIEKVKPIWDSCVHSDFVQGLKEGTLAEEKFKNYMIQDSLYLIGYAKVFGQAIYYANTFEEIQVYYNMLSFVSDTESQARLDFLKPYGLTDADIAKMPSTPENKSYVDFMLHVAKGGNGTEILMAVLPCMVAYSYVFTTIANEAKEANSKYWNFIKDYASVDYANNCKVWCDFADEKIQELSDEQQEKLFHIFEKGSEHELEFWHMAYK